MQRKLWLLGVALIACSTSLIIWRAVVRVSKLESAIDARSSITEQELIELVGEPDVILSRDAIYRGSGPCSQLTRQCDRAYWHASPLAILYPSLWLFAIDQERRVVSRYRYSSP